MGCKARKGARAFPSYCCELQSPIRWAVRQRTRLLPRFDPRRGTMRYVLYLLLVMAFAMEVHAVVVNNIADALAWSFGVITVALLINVEKHERDDE